jgi:hypothetical protein
MRFSSHPLPQAACGPLRPPLVKGQTLEERHNSHDAIERALLRVRHRHEKAGDAHKYTFGELLREARKELDEQCERMRRTGKDDYGESFT